jgi:hypothetical protein
MPTMMHGPASTRVGRRLRPLTGFCWSGGVGVVTGERFVVSRALWRVGAISEALVTFASPSAVGLSAVAGAVAPVPRAAPFGLYLSLAPPERPPRVVAVALAPGLVAEVGVLEASRVDPGQVVALAARPAAWPWTGNSRSSWGRPTA